MILPRLTAACLLVAPLPALAGASPIVDTGQSRCYDDFRAIPCPAPGQDWYGQDAQHRRHPARYRDNGDGTISDLVTGLMWQKEAQRASWRQAPALAEAARTGGHDDWRVPSIKQLYSLINFDGASGTARPDSRDTPADARPYLDTRFFSFATPEQGRHIDVQYLSATAYTGLTMRGDRAFFGVNFADGRIKAYPQDGGPGRRLWFLRLVRGNPAYGDNAFHDNGDGTVSDRATGLMWSRADSGGFAADLGRTAKRDGRLDWKEALRFCNGLTLAGHRDWRLPSAKELQSLVDYRRSPQATGSAALDPIFAVSAITDEAGHRNWPYFWSATTHLDGPEPGRFAVYVAFGEAQGYPGRRAFGPQGRRDGMEGPPDGRMDGPPQGGMMGEPPPDGMMAGPPPGGGGPPDDTAMLMSMDGPPPGGARPPPGNGRDDETGGATGALLDVHGAGAQRSSPKSGDEAALPRGRGPQGDVLRIYNYARCVRDLPDRVRPD